MSFETMERIFGKDGRRGPLLFVALLFLVALLPGCATTRYVTIPCIAKDQALPVEPDKVGPRLTGHADEDVRILAGNAIRLRAYGQGLRGIIEGCRG